MTEYFTNTEMKSYIGKINAKLQEILDLLGRNKLIVNFDTMGGNFIPPITVYKDQPFGFLPIPYFSGHDFEGWFLNVFIDTAGNYVYSDEITNLTTVSTTGAITLYAKWDDSWIAVRLNPTGGTVQPETISVQYMHTYGEAWQGTGLPRGLPIPYHVQATFGNWYYKIGSKDYVVTNSSTLTTLSPPELSVSWRDDNFTLSFDLNGADGFVQNIGGLRLDEDITLYTWNQISNDVEFPGKKFLGWSKTKSAYDIISHVVIDRDTLVYAIWENEKYSIVFYDLNLRQAGMMDTYLNVPNYLSSIEDLNGRFNGFNHWDSTPGTYADYLKMTDGDLFYNLAETADTVVSLYASASPITMQCLSIDSDFQPGDVEVGKEITLNGADVSAFLSDTVTGSIVSEIVTDAVRISPRIASQETSSFYVTFKYDGDDTEYLLYPLNIIPTLVKIQVESPPVKTEYSKGETFDLLGMHVYAISSNGFSADVTLECEYDPTVDTPLDLSNDTVIVSYRGKKTYQSIFVKNTAIPESIEVVIPPFKTEYNVGDSLDVTGIMVVASYRYTGTTNYFLEDVTEYCTYSPSENLQKYDKNITVSFTYDIDEQPLTATFRISIEDTLDLVAMKIVSPPSKTQYDVGDTFDPAGMMLSILFNNDTSLNNVPATIDNCIFSPYENIPLNANRVMVTYFDGEFTPVTDYTSISVSLSCDNVVEFLINDPDNPVINAQNTNLTKYVKYLNANEEYQFDESYYDDEDIMVIGPEVSCSISCLFMDSADEDGEVHLSSGRFSFSNMLLAEEFQPSLLRISFANSGKLSVSTIANLFRGCSSLSSVNLGNSICNFGNYAFYGCENISSLTFTNQIGYVGDYAFANCHSLRTIVNSQSISSIGSMAFLNCESLTSINLSRISEYSKEIGSNAFSNCSSLVSIEGLENLNSVGDYAFYGCSNLRNLYPASMTSISISGSIGRFAFRECGKLSCLIDVTSAYTSINGYVFEDSPNISLVFTDVEELSDVENFEGYPWGLPEENIACGT